MPKDLEAVHHTEDMLVQQKIVLMLLLYKTGSIFNHVPIDVIRVVYLNVLRYFC